MKYGIFVDIIGGDSHGELLKDRADNLADHHSKWNTSFQLKGHDKPYCISVEGVTLVTPKDKVTFSLMLIEKMLTVSEALVPMLVFRRNKEKEPTAECTVWQLVGRPHLWGAKDEGNQIAFVQYDAVAKEGSMLVIVTENAISDLTAEFPDFYKMYEFKEADIETLRSIW